MTSPSAPSFDFKGPWFRTDEASAYLCYRGKNALRSLYRFLKKKGVPTARRFRTVLIAKADLDRAISANHRIHAVRSKAS